MAPIGVVGNLRQWVRKVVLFDSGRRFPGLSQAWGLDTITHTHTHTHGHLLRLGYSISIAYMIEHEHVLRTGLNNSENKHQWQI